MTEFVSTEELVAELKAVDPKDKFPVFSGRNYPIEYIDSREFERLIYFLFQKEIDDGEFKDTYDTVLLMKGTSERGRDSILQYKGKNVGVIQCKRYISLVTAPDMCREVIKFCLHALQDKDLIEVEAGHKFTYYFTALKGFNDPALKMFGSFNTKIVESENLEAWVNEVLENNKTLKFKAYNEVENDLKILLKSIDLKLLIGTDIDLKLKKAKDVVKMFFEVEKVVDRDLMWEFGEKFLGFKSNEDMEKLRLRLQDIPKENILSFGLFNLYGYDTGFYKKLLADQSTLRHIADIKLKLSTLFIDYLNETIDRYERVYIPKLIEISPFTKQVVKPYLFNKFALQHHVQEAGEFLHKILNRQGIVNQRQSIEDHKNALLEVGKQVLSNDYSKFVGEGELLDLKKKVARFIHAEFTSVQEMSERFDKDMVILMPTLEMIEREIAKIMPVNGTLIIENNSSLNSQEDFINLMKAAKAFENLQKEP